MKPSYFIYKQHIFRETDVLEVFDMYYADFASIDDTEFELDYIQAAPHKRTNNFSDIVEKLRQESKVLIDRYWNTWPAEMEQAQYNIEQIKILKKDHPELFI